MDNIETFLWAFQLLQCRGSSFCQKQLFYITSSIYLRAKISKYAQTAVLSLHLAVSIDSMNTKYSNVLMELSFI